MPIPFFTSHKSMRYLLLILVFLSSSAWAQLATPCRLKEATSVLPLQACTRYLSQAELKAQFPYAPDLSENGDWVSVQFQAIAGEYLLDIGIPDAFQIHIFSVEHGQIRPLMKLNAASTFKDRFVLHRSLLLPLHIDAEFADTNTKLLIHYRTHGKTPLFMRLFPKQIFLDRDTLENLLNGIIFGLLLIVIPLLVVGFQSVQNRSYRLYAGVVLVNLAFLLQIDGYSFQFLWPESPHWNMQAPNMIGCGIMLMHILFAIQFLQLRQRLVRLYLWHIGFLWLLAAVFVLEAIFNVQKFLIALTAAYGIFAVVTAYRGLRLQIPAARFYLIGTIIQGIFVLGLLFISITIGNPLPFIPVLSYPKIGYIAEALFFAAAVVQQIRLFGEHQAELRVRRLTETEQLLQAEQSKLMALEKAKQQQLQLASASHDIAQPLASLRFALAALSQKPENKAIADHVENTLNYAQSLLKELILQSRDAQADVADDSIDLQQVFKQLAQEFETLAQQKGLDLAIHNTHLQFTGSSVLLYRILNNLLANAIRYTQQGRIVLGVRRRTNAIEIQIWDTGPGIASDTLTNLLQAFQQAEQAEQNTAGYGLGLFIVNTLCKQCGYQLKIHSRLGKGSGFCLWIPLTERL